MKNTQKGFVVPLLVIIIAILLWNIGTHVYRKQVTIPLNRSIGDDAALGSWITIISQQAKTYYSATGNTYFAVCADSSVAEALTKAQEIAGAVPTCNSSATVFAISFPSLLATDNNKKFWCADSTGFNSKTAAPLGMGTICPK